MKIKNENDRTQFTSIAEADRAATEYEAEHESRHFCRTRFRRGTAETPLVAWVEIRKNHRKKLIGYL